MSYTPPPPPPPPPGGSGSPSPDVGAALAYGWKKFQTYAGPLILAMLIPFAASIFVSLAGSLVFPDGLGGLVVQVLAWVASTMGAIGVWRIALMIVAGEVPDIGRAYQYDRWGEWLAFSFVYGLIVGIGFMLCFVPGLIAMALFGLAPLYFIDGRRSLGDALSASQRAASAQKFAIPVFLTLIVGLLGIMVCVVGVLVTMPVAYVGLAYLYRGATDQPVAG